MTIFMASIPPTTPGACQPSATQHSRWSRMHLVISNGHRGRTLAARWIRHLAACVLTAATFVAGTRELNADPTLFVRNFNTSSNASQILRFDATTGASLGNFLVGYDGSYISSFAFGPDKNLYIGRQFDGKIDRYHGTTGAFIDTFVLTTGVTNLAFGPDGNLYAGRSSIGIDKFDGATGASLGRFITPPNGLDVAGMTFRGSSLYVGYGAVSNGAFYRYDAASGSNAVLVSGSLYANGPRAPSFDGAGSIYLPVWQTNKIFKYNETTLALTGTITTAAGISANSLAFDESGTMLLLSDNGSQSRINRYDPVTGAFIDVLVAPGTGGLGRATNMILVVPEPATWAMAATALGYGVWRLLRCRRTVDSSLAERR
jgi:hypothetical protein